MTPEERFWSKVDIRGEDECWPWTAALKNIDRNYGTFYFEGKLKAAHRHALELKLGRPLHPGMESLHTCDNGVCINPDHLFEGTQKVNMQDCVTKGRHVSGFAGKSGESCPSYKFTDDQVKEMRRLKKEGAKWKDLMSQFLISRGNLASILSGRTRKLVK